MSFTLSQAAARGLRSGGAFHVPPQAAPLGSTVTLTVYDAPSAPEAVIIDTRRPELTWKIMLRAGGDGTYSADLVLPSQPTTLTYTFAFIAGATLREKRQKEGRNTPIYREWEEFPFKIAVYDPDQMPADWTRA